MIILYIILLSKIHLKGERDYLNKCPNNAICNYKQVGNKSIVNINYCKDEYVKLENGFIQICSPDYEPKFSEYKDTLRAARYISDIDGDCFFEHDRIDHIHLKNLFPNVDTLLLQNEKDFFTVFKNGEFKSTWPKINSMCRVYRNCSDAFYIQTMIIALFTVGTICYGFNILYKLDYFL